MASFRYELFQSPRIRRIGVLALLGAAAAFVGVPSGAHPPYSSDIPYSVTLQDEQGGSLRTFRQDGTAFALGRLGERYEVRIENHTNVRVEAVVTVDGRDAVSGNVGDFVHERGYIVGPHGSVTINGFRRSLDETAAFRFSAPSSSYGARMGTPENVGVIGVAFFPERPITRRPRPPVRAWREERPSDPYTSGTWGRSAPSDTSASAEPPRSTAKDELGGAAKGAAPSPAASTPTGQARGADAPSARRRASEYSDAWKADDTRDAEGSARSRLGTEYGESTWSHVTEVSFERQNRWSPAVVFSVRYDDADGLMARGIDVYPRPYWPEPVPTSPDPFPRSRFAPPPP